jgi:hypothetical protein
VLGFRVKFTLPRGTGVATSRPSDSLELGVDRTAKLESSSKVTILGVVGRTAMSFLIVRDTRVCCERNPVGSSEFSIAEQRLWGKSWDGFGAPLCQAPCNADDCRNNSQPAGHPFCRSIGCGRPDPQPPLAFGQVSACDTCAAANATDVPPWCLDVRQGLRNLERRSTDPL